MKCLKIVINVVFAITRHWTFAYVSDIQLICKKYLKSCINKKKVLKQKTIVF